MPYENVDETNIVSISQKVESAIRDICSSCSCQSIIERVLTDLCLSHYNTLSGMIIKSMLKEDFEDKMSRFFFQSPTLQTPHYLACFSTIYSASEEPIREAEYGKLRALVTLWLFLTEIPYSGLLYYFDRLRVNPETFDLDQSFRVKDFVDSRAKFREFLSEHSFFEIFRPQAMLPTIFRAALENLDGIDDIISNQIGVHPSKIIKALFDLTFEWGETFMLPLDVSVAQDVAKAQLQTCNFLMDYPLECLGTILKPIPVEEIEQLFSYVTLTAERASKYIESRKTRKRNQEMSMHSYPLWDYPSLRINQNFLSHPALLVECVEELSYRFICCSKEAMARFVNAQHKKLVEKVFIILAENGFDKTKTNLKVTEARIEKAQFDIVASKNRKILHIECKTERTPWRIRMYFNSKELEKEGRDFLRHNKLGAEAWNDKLRWLGTCIENHFGFGYKESSNIVITDTPTPAQDICEHVKIMWVERLKDFLHSSFMFQ